MTAFSPPSAGPPFNKKAPAGVEFLDEIAWKGRQSAAKAAWPWEVSLQAH